MMEEEKKTITREKHPGRVTQGHKLAAVIKKRKEETLHNKEQSSEQLQNSPLEQLHNSPSVQLQNSP